MSTSYYTSLDVQVREGVITIKARSYKHAQERTPVGESAVTFPEKGVRIGCSFTSSYFEGDLGFIVVMARRAGTHRIEEASFFEAYNGPGEILSIVFEKDAAITAEEVFAQLRKGHPEWSALCTEDGAAAVMH